MACVAIPQQFARIGKFKGDGEGLVDCLIKACEQRPASSAVSASFGRELVPWTDDTTLGMALEPLECSGRGSGSMFPATSKTDPKGSPAHKAPTSKRAKASGSPRSSSTRVAQPAGGKRTSTNGFACPALASAPKPCDLPMPTFGLMSRAILRSRSPSPGKDAAASSFFHPGQMQQLVRPVAA